MKVFFDANFLVAAGLRPDGDYSKILLNGKDIFLTSEHILDEVARNLSRLGRDANAHVNWLRKIMTVTDRFDLLPAGTPLSGSGDRQALAEAIGAGCDLFVTSDTDFSALFGQTIKGVRIEKSAIYARKSVYGET